jgi:hypothetical protein
VRHRVRAIRTGIYFESMLPVETNRPLIVAEMAAVRASRWVANLVGSGALQRFLIGKKLNHHACPGIDRENPG